MSDTQNFGKWTVEETLKNNRCYLATSEDGTKGVVKIHKERKGELVKEVEALKKADHPNIVNLIDYNLEAETPFLVTEYCGGGNLTKEHLQKSREKRIDYFVQAVKAMLHLQSREVTLSSDCGYILKEDLQTLVLVDFEFSKTNAKAGLMLNRHFQDLVLIGDQMEGKKLASWTFDDRVQCFYRLVQELGEAESHWAAQNHIAELSQFYWELMEGKRFNAVYARTRRISKKIESLTSELEKLKQQKAELLN